MIRNDNFVAVMFMFLTVAVMAYMVSPSTLGQKLDSLPTQQANPTQPPRQARDKSVAAKVPKKDIGDAQLYMRAKLANSQRVMEGLVTEDFELIGKGARQMKRIAEAAHWPNAIDEVYQFHSASFRKQCDKLADHAERRDLQAAHYTYLHMSTTCIDCHNYVRGRFRVEQTERGGPVQLIPTQWDGPAQERPEPPQPDIPQGKQDRQG